MKITEETKKALEEGTLSNFEVYTKLIDGVRRSITMIDDTEKHTTNLGLNIPEPNHHLRRISEYTLLLGLVWLDITAGFRIYLNAKENYEVLYSAKQLLITINESFKQIYNYVPINSNGNNKRNGSFWVKDIGVLVNSKLTHLSAKYNSITAELDLYDDDELQSMHNPRKLFVHYDPEPSKVYDNLINLDIEKMAKKMIPFMTILSKMIFFSQELLNDYNRHIEQDNEDFYSREFKKIEDLKANHIDSPKLLDLLNQMQATLLEFRKM